MTCWTYHNRFSWLCLRARREQVFSNSICMAARVYVHVCDLSSEQPALTTSKGKSYPDMCKALTRCFALPCLVALPCLTSLVLSCLTRVTTEVSKQTSGIYPALIPTATATALVVRG